MIYWVILLGFLTCLLYWRGDFLDQSPTVILHQSVIDVAIFVAWLALLLTPLFQEVSIFGLTVKKEIKPLSAPSVKTTSEINYIEEDASE